MEFQEVFEVYCDSLNDLLVEVFDDDIGKDDFLGTVSIDLSNIANNRLSNDIWVPLESCASGEILLSEEKFFYQLNILQQMFLLH